MACLPINEAERKQIGHTVFFEGQEDRFFNVDEICIYLDGKTEKRSGCLSSTPSTFGIAETGEGKIKSSKKCTIQFGIAGNQILPPHIIVSTSASDERDGNLDSKMFPAFHDVYGQFGREREYP